MRSCDEAYYESRRRHALVINDLVGIVQGCSRGKMMQRTLRATLRSILQMLSHN